MKKSYLSMIAGILMLLACPVYANDESMEGGLPELQNQVNGLTDVTSDLLSKLDNLPEIYFGGPLSVSEYEECINHAPCTSKTDVFVAITDKRSISFEVSTLGGPTDKIFIQKYGSEDDYSPGEILVMNGCCGDMLSPVSPLTSSEAWDPGAPPNYPFKGYFISNSLIRLVFEDIDTVKQNLSESEAQYIDFSFAPWSRGEKDLHMNVTIQNIGSYVDYYVLSVWSRNADRMATPAQFSERLGPSATSVHDFVFHFEDGIPESPYSKIGIILQSVSGSYWDGDDGSHFRLISIPPPTE